MRKLVLGTLLVLMPFSGMRVMCIDAPTDEHRSSAPTETLSDCERLCPLHPPSNAASSSDAENGPDCALSADGMSLSIVASIAVPQPLQPLQVPLVVSHVSADSPSFYLEPALAYLGPPPKRKAL